ncbi:MULTISPECIES: hypothetical protein [Arthrobacter]|uniref:Uncharacterized protein n=1 Tax=Arthrobacter terricola TaxID=2547396 RepID=A0A4R5K676_9MICC|nr:MULTISPECIES: hypothetical protein [Arthrobacter]MBT8161706.1 hypothetical protein [Arthrobacter sp. GN70]TDF89391.1 hypothetical protein E1809_23005 [Arthrobacter terricola]
MIAEIVIQVVVELIQGWFDGRATPRVRVLRALDLSRKSSLSRQQREFGEMWLTYGLGHLPDLGLEPRAREIREGLMRVERFPWEGR